MRKLARMTMNYASGGQRIPQFDVSDRLRKARESAGLSQDELAAEIGISRRTITRYEQGVPLKKSVLLLYAMRTNVPVAWLETGNPGPSNDDPGFGVHPPGLEPGTHWFTAARPVARLFAGEAA